MHTKKTAAEELPGCFEADHGAVHIIKRKMKPFGQFSRCRRADAFHPTEYDGTERRVIPARKHRINLRLIFRCYPPSYFLRLTLYP